MILLAGVVAMNVAWRTHKFGMIMNVVVADDEGRTLVGLEAPLLS